MSTTTTSPAAAPLAEAPERKAAGGARARRHRPHRKGPLRRMVMHLRNGIVWSRCWVYRRILKMDLHPSVRFSLKTRLDFTNPRGVHIGADTYLAFGAVVLAHDMSRLIHCDTRIGRNCFVGANAIVMPGVTIGDQVIVGSGAVVTADVPSHCIVAGNPAKVVKSGIRTRAFGILLDEYEQAVAAAAAERGAA